MGSRIRSRIRPVLQVGAFAAAMFVVRASFADHYRVPSESMEPNVQVGDHVVVSKASYGLRLPMTTTYLARFREPARGDVVVLEADGPDVLLKRVVAVAGDVVEVKDGHVRIGGTSVSEPPLGLDSGGGPDFGPVRVPDHEILVLGDNRGNSRDGRTFGWVDENRVLGRVVAVVTRDGSFTWQPL